MKKLQLTMKGLIVAGLSLITANVSAQYKFQAFNEQKVTSNHCIYVSDKIKSKPKQYVFKTVNEALRCAEKLCAQRTDIDNSPISIYISPSVYWINNPDTPETILPEAGERAPFGMRLKFSDINLIGLSQNPKDVVLACQRGQTQGADGNFTMFHFTGDNISADNITFGNYCNVDLVYPLNPKLNRAKRADAIVQAQLVICKGKNYKIRNCEFISRLNLCPFVGADDVLFENCYFECTDDALCGTGTYRDCRFTFFSSKPFYATSPKGAVFENCDIHTKSQGIQYLTKASSPVTLRNCRWTSDDPNLVIEWTSKPNPKHKCYMIGCTLNGKALVVPTTPDVPMPVPFPAFGLSGRETLQEGQWTLGAYCPSDLGVYTYDVDKSRPAWIFSEGMDGAEGCYGLIQNVRGARMMYTGLSTETYKGQILTMNLDPCKGPGQGFGSATGQYLDICLKFDTKTLTGYGIRFTRTPNYDKAVEVFLVKYENGTITTLTAPQKCTIFRRGCVLTLTYNQGHLSANISNANESMLIESNVTDNAFGGIHIQHTGTVGAGATVISKIQSKYSE